MLPCGSLLRWLLLTSHSLHCSLLLVRHMWRHLSSQVDIRKMVHGLLLRLLLLLILHLRLLLLLHICDRKRGHCGPALLLHDILLLRLHLVAHLPRRWRLDARLPRLISLVAGYIEVSGYHVSLLRIHPKVLIAVVLHATLLGWRWSWRRIVLIPIHAIHHEVLTLLRSGCPDSV